MQTPKADRYLMADKGMGPLVAKAGELRLLTRACTDFLPPELGRQIRGAQLKDGELSLLAANAAAAAKLRLVADSLRKFLLQQGRKVNSVSVRVQPTRSHAPQPAQGKQARLSEGGKAAISALYERLDPASPVRRAAGELLRHQGVKAASTGVPRRSAPGRKRGERGNT
jgi:hypothetical protein